MSASSFFRIMPLFIVIFVDTFCGTMLLPLLPGMLINAHTSILPHDTTPIMRYFIFGLTQGISSIAMLFGAPILGDLSDRLGRKKILLISLIGYSLAYLMAVAGVLMRSVSILLFGRIIAGFTGGSLSTAQAAIVDISALENRTVNLGYVLLAISMGSILGPLISGTLSNPHWVNWFHITTPLYFASAISLLNIIYLQFAFQETFVPTEKKPIHLLSGLNVFISAFTIPGLFNLTIAFLFMQLGWATFVQFIALYLALQYHFSATEIGIYMACIGVGFTLAFCYLLELLTNNFTLHKIAVTSLSLIAIFILMIIVFNKQATAWIMGIPAATCLAISYSVLISLFSQEVNKEKQGWVMGLTGAISAFSFGITGLTAGLLANLSAVTPLWLAFGSVTFSAIAMIVLTGRCKA